MLFSLTTLHLPKTNFIKTAIGLAIVLPLFVISATQGSAAIGLPELLDWLAGQANEQTAYIIENIRLPRSLFTLLAGGALALAGYLMQILVRNPLADPYILGTASGAAVGANLAFAGWLPLVFLQIYMPPVYGFVVSLAVTILVLMMAGRGWRSDKVLLAGVAVSSLLTAFIGLLAFLSESPDKLRTIIFWTLGHLGSADWTSVVVLFVVLLMGLTVSLLISKQLQILTLGEEKAALLGANTRHIRLVVLFLSATLTAFVVSFVGIIGFVGLIVPHVVRSLFPYSIRQNIVGSLWAGAAFLLLCDLLSRWFYPPVGLPVGIITALAGSPLFVYLLAQRKYAFN